MTATAQAHKCLHQPCNRKTFDGYCYQHKYIPQGGGAGSPESVSPSATATPPKSSGNDPYLSKLITASAEEAYSVVDMVARELGILEHTPPNHNLAGVNKVSNALLLISVRSYMFEKIPALDASLAQSKSPADSVTLSFEKMAVNDMMPYATRLHPDEIFSLLKTKGEVAQKTGNSDLIPWQNAMAISSQIVRMEWEIAQHEGIKELGAFSYEHGYEDYVEQVKQHIPYAVQQLVARGWQPQQWTNIVGKMEGRLPLAPQLPTRTGIEIREQRAQEQKLKVQQEELRRMAEEKAQQERELEELRRQNAAMAAQQQHMAQQAQHNAQREHYQSPGSQQQAGMPHNATREQFDPSKPRSVWGILGDRAGTMMMEGLNAVYDNTLGETAQRRAEARRKKEEREAAEREKQKKANEAIERAAATKAGMTLEEFQEMKRKKAELLEAQIIRNRESAREFGSRADSRKRHWLFG